MHTILALYQKKLVQPDYKKYMEGDLISEQDYKAYNALHEYKMILKQHKDTYPELNQWMTEMSSMDFNIDNDRCSICNIVFTINFI
jgi:hypothetical protein